MTFRFTAKTKSSKKDIITVEADDLEHAKARYRLCIAKKRNPRKLIKVEALWHGCGISGWINIIRWGRCN